LIPRYTRPAMAEIWSDRTRLGLWLEVELLAVEGWAALGVVPAEDARALRERVRVDPERMAALEARTGHDVASFVEALAETAGPPGRWLHFGLTSNDVVDTALGVQLARATDLLLQGVDALLRTAAELAQRYRDLPEIGRTHGVHAEPITFGLKAARWYAELRRGRARLAAARAEVAVGKVSGPVGTYAGLDPKIEAFVCERLGLRPAEGATQVVSRDRHAAWLSALAVLAGTLDYIATEIRGLQRTEIREVEEPFRGGQKGSSSMPHKRNPEKCERISGLARVVRAHAGAALADQALWHERDISHSSVERIVLPDAAIALDYMLDLLRGVLEGLVVHPGAMAANLERTRGLWASGQVLLLLIRAGLGREEAYRLVQEHALAAWEDPEGPDFRSRLEADPRVRAALDPAVLGSAFDVRHQLRFVPTIFERLGLGEAERGGAG
jgi:adenylosuccinate lyase